MPAPCQKRRPHPGQNWPLARAAALGRLVVLRCGYCRRLKRCLASDLVTVLDPRRDALEPPIGCSRCRLRDYLSVKLQLPELLPVWWTRG